MEIAKYSAEELGWQRKTGPVKVWRVFDGRKNSEDGKRPKFSVQEIPEDRQIDVLNFMMDNFLPDEPICRSCGIKNDPAVRDDFRQLWSFALGQGIVVGAFLVDENNPKPIIAGVNMTLVRCDASTKGSESALQFSSKFMPMVLDVFHQLEDAKDTMKVYNVDKYISAAGLSVSSQFRGQGIGEQLLRARKEMSVAYGIDATSTIFTAPAAQHVASKVGFELLVEREFASFKKDDGSECFPGIDSKSCKLMGMRL